MKDFVASPLCISSNSLLYTLKYVGINVTYKHTESQPEKNKNSLPRGFCYMNTSLIMSERSVGKSSLRLNDLMPVSFLAEL